MDDIPKIEFNRSPAELKASPPEAPQKVTRIVGKSHTNGLIVVMLLLFLVGGAYAVFSRFIVWDDGSEIEKKSTAYIPDKLPVQYESTPGSAPSSSGLDNTVKGKITVTLTREDNLPLETGVVRLTNAAGKVIKEINGYKMTTFVFDEIPAGSYVVAGGKKGESRLSTKNVTLGPGDIIAVSLSVFYDKKVSITVNVKKSDGSPFANQSFTLLRDAGDQHDEFSVTTNSNGIFTKSGVAPYDNWQLFLSGTEVATFTVAATGQNQTINVKTNSN